ncbi:hypothetical protein PIROE2DRAFT_5325, partial [Piromyces sp. E2]
LFKKPIKADNYIENKFVETRGYYKLNLEARCGYKLDSTVLKAAKLVNPSFPDCCFCCKEDNCEQSLEKKVLQSYVISKAIYFSPLLGSNKHKTARIQTLINTGLFWCIGSYTHKKSSGNSYNKSEYLRHNPTMSTYAISRDLEIPPIAGTCAALQNQTFLEINSGKLTARMLKT